MLAEQRRPPPARRRLPLQVDEVADDADAAVDAGARRRTIRPSASISGSRKASRFIHESSRTASAGTPASPRTSNQSSTRRSTKWYSSSAAAGPAVGGVDGEVVGRQRRPRLLRHDGLDQRGHLLLGRVHVTQIHASRHW